jgi:hypoxanthine-DNA glycosylase
MNKRLSGLDPIVDKKTKILILGSFPSKESLKAKQYYANHRNQFWRVMSDVLSIRNLLSAPYREKKHLLFKAKIGLWDVVESCVRKGNSDRNIKKVIVNDFDLFLRKYSNITALFFNGRKAMKIFNKKYADIKIVAHYLPSTSSAYAISYKKKKQSWAKLLEYL